MWFFFIYLYTKEGIEELERELWSAYDRFTNNMPIHSLKQYESRNVDSVDSTEEYDIEVEYTKE